MRVLLAAFAAFLLFPNLAQAQLAGTDVVLGGSCASYPSGATVTVADSDSDFAHVVLICDGTNWQAVETVVKSSSGDPPLADGTTISSIGEISDVTINSPADNQVLTYSSGSWVNSASLWTSGTADDIYYDATTPQVGIGTTSPGAELHVVGDIHYTGIIRDVSDMRQKREIKPVRGALEKIRGLRGVSFVMLGDEQRRTEYGLIAQDVQKVFPELVHTGSDGMMSLNYMGLFAPTVEAIKTLDAENKALREELTASQEQVSKLQSQLNAIDRRMQVLEGKTRPKYSPYNR